MSAYAVVGPTKRKPRFLSSFAIAVDSGVTAGTSAGVRGRGRGSGAKDQRSSASGTSTAARALAIVASIFARLRTIPASAISRATSSSPNAATRSISNPAKAARNASRLRVDQVGDAVGDRGEHERGDAALGERVEALAHLARRAEDEDLAHELVR